MPTPLEQQAHQLAHDLLNVALHSQAPHDVVMGALLGVYQSYALTYACCGDGVRACLHGLLAKLDERDARYQAQTDELIKRLSGPVPPATH